MNQDQRARALRLARELDQWRVGSNIDAAVALLRELAAEPVRVPLRPVNVEGPEHLAPRPAPGLEFDARGVLVPAQSTERVPLTQEQVATVMSAFYSDADHAEMMLAADFEKCRAVERAHGITGDAK